MQEPELSRAIALIQGVAAQEFAIELSRAEVEPFLRGVLFEPRNLWSATQSGLVTPRETAGAIAGRLYTWLMTRSGRTWSQAEGAEWGAFIDQLEQLLTRSAPD